MTRALRTRSLLAALLVLGQLAALWHGLEHAGRHDRAGQAISGDHAHHDAFDLGGAHRHVLGERPGSAGGGDHEEAPCDLCLLATAGTALVGASSVEWANGAARDSRPLVRDVPTPERRARHRSARAPPPRLS